jgi:hypothetical protein
MDDHEARRIKKAAQKTISEAQKIMKAPKIAKREKIDRLFDIMTREIESSRRHIHERE